MSQREKDRRSFLKEGAAAVAAVGLGQTLLGCERPPGGTADSGGEEVGVLDAGVDASLVDAGQDVAGDVTPDVGYPDAAAPAKRPTTTVRERITGVLPVKKQPSSTRSQWGQTKIVAGEKHKRTDLLKVDATKKTPTGKPASFLYMVQLSDTHIVDEESPARSVSMDDAFGSAWRTQEAHNLHVLDAMVRKIKKLAAFRPVDLVLLTGDCIDNNQKNELAWCLKVLEGGTVNPNSGDKEDPVKGSDNDPHDPFAAAGLGNIPWLLTFGNHDSLVQGNFPRDFGGGKWNLIQGDPTRGEIKLPELGRVNPPRCDPIPASMSPTPARCRPRDHAKLGTGKLPADKERAHLNRQQWMNMLHKAAGKPAGHGLASTNLATGRGDLVFDPVPGVPLRVVVLDTAADTFPPGAIGVYSKDHHDKFLLPALKKAQADEVLVIVASHHPVDSTSIGGSRIRQTLHSFPNVVLHLAGHRHHNQVMPRTSKVSPAHGYWEVETCALVDWPQQGRLVELVDCRDGTGEIWLTMFDHDTDHKPLGALVEGARFFALKEVHSGEEGAGGPGGYNDRNVVLPVVIPDAIHKKLAKLPGSAIESRLL